MRKGPASVPAFRNTGLSVLTMICLMAAGAASEPQPPAPAKTGTESPPYLPPVSLPASPRQTEGKEMAAKASKKSVLLPSLDEVPNGRALSRPSRDLPFLPSGERRQAPKRSDTTPLLEPPPVVGSKSRSLPAPDSIVEVIIGQPRMLAFPEVPQRIALNVDEADPVASLREVPHRPREWYLIGKKPGTAFLDVWLPDLSSATLYRSLHYLVRVRSDTEEKKRPEPVVADREPPHPKIPAEMPREAIYETLEGEINRTFPGSSVRLKRAGDKLVVSGYARNIFEATRILNIARENAPGKSSANAATPPASPSLQAVLDNYALAGGSNVVSLLRIPGEQQIMLRIVVAEVNRAAARSLGLDFGLGEKQATILGDHDRASDNSTTLVGNGWIGQTLRILQERGFAQALAEPTLTTLNGQATRFQAGGEFPVPVVSPSPMGPVQGVSFRSYGVRLSVQPVVADGDRIRLTVDAEVSGTDPSATARVTGTAVPGLKVRNFQSTVELRKGETLAVAGLNRGTEAPAPPAQQQPGVARPVSAEVGAAGQELVVLISPLLLRSPEPNARTVSRGRSFSAQDVELYLRSGNSVVPRGDALLLIGPQGYAGQTRQGSVTKR
jgi:pilus assembly protein CpaC